MFIFIFVKMGSSRFKTQDYLPSHLSRVMTGFLCGESLVTVWLAGAGFRTRLARIPWVSYFF